jgi:hypothetical protein
VQKEGTSKALQNRKQVIGVRMISRCFPWAFRGTAGDDPFGGGFLHVDLARHPPPRSGFMMLFLLMMM